MMGGVTYIDQFGNHLTPDQVPIEVIMRYVASAPGGGGGLDLLPFIVAMLIPVVYAIVCLCTGYYEEDGV